MIENNFNRINPEKQKNVSIVNVHAGHQMWAFWSSMRKRSVPKREDD